MIVLVYRTLVSRVEVPDGLFTYDENGVIEGQCFFNWLGDNCIELEGTEEVEEEREAVVIEEEK